jgi:hypothetical protein
VTNTPSGRSLVAMRVLPLALLLLGLSGGSLCACRESGRAAAHAPGPTLRSALERTLAAGPARVQAAVRTGPARYRLVGRVDPSKGYRLCAAIRQAPRRYQERRSLWLEGSDWSYGTLTAFGRRCGPSAFWLDDHPPTLALVDGNHGHGSRAAGAEDYLHAELLALTRLPGRAASRPTVGDCGGSRCFRVVVAFGMFDREAPQRDEDGWTLRPLLRALGRQPVELRVSPAGFVDRVRLVAPGGTERIPARVRVGLRLSRFGEALPVPHVEAKGIE